jgi:hypothetical protein
MLKFTFLVYPKRSHPRYGEIEGAYAAVFVSDPGAAATPEGAAHALLQESGWDVAELDSVISVRSEDAPDAPWEAHYQQALQDGTCAVLHTWPVGAPEEEPSRCDAVPATRPFSPASSAAHGRRSAYWSLRHANG